MTLEDDLKQSIAGEVRFNTGDRAMYASDSSNYRHVPMGVVVPRSVEDMVKAITVCAKHNAPIVHRGGGTSLAGQAISTGAVVIDSSKYCHALLSLDRERKLATVEPGCVLDDLRDAAEKFHLTFGPDPATHNHNTLGGMIGNNSGGVHSVYAGRTVDNVESLEIMTYDGLRMTVGKTSAQQMQERGARPGREGEIYRALIAFQEKYGDEIRRTFPHLPRLVSGYRLEFLLPENDCHIARALVGTESTCVSVLRATVNLVDDPPKVLIILGFDSIEHLADAIPDIVKFKPLACEALDYMMVDLMKKKNFMVEQAEKLPEGKAWLEIQIGGTTDEDAQHNGQKFVAAFRHYPHVTAAVLETDKKLADDLWNIRKAGLPVTAWVPGQKRDTWEGWEDSAVPRDKLGEYVRKLKALMAQHDYEAAMYGHFGDGLIHMRLNSGLSTDGEVKNFRAFMEAAAILVTSLGGSLSGEHGDGQSRTELLPHMYTPKIITAFAEFKAIWDPTNKMNPGDKVQPAKKLDQDLRFGPNYRPKPLKTIFSYRDEDSDFRRAALRCVGVGECRKHETGTMCPSYRATREEKHSTRGRARMFQEMLQGNPVRDGWKSQEVKEALHLCLSCKACKKECPVNVDMATYKSEFMYHHYKTERRPIIHYAVGMIPIWARLATCLPGMAVVANFVASLKPIKALLGIHRDRAMPKFAARTFRNRFKNDKRTGPRVILWTDTFNNHFTPHVLEAAVQVIRKAGWHVELTAKNICCGRPYYDFGMLDKAKAHLQTLMDRLGDELDDNTWIVGVEPSCVGVFRDELRNMYPDDPRAKLLRERTLMLGEFLTRHTDFQPPATDRKIVVHGHCHQKSILSMQEDEQLLKAMSAQVNMLDSGCCGMAGSFGYEKDKYDVSLTIANDRLLPAVNAAAADDLIVASGFSCRTQINGLSARRGLTMPEILAGQFETKDVI